MKIILRPEQEDILAYQSGKMGISAVPGSGKTFTLALLASEILKRGELRDDQEVLIVTLVNSAVDIFYKRVSQFLEYRGLLPNVGYRVRTLHGLAHEIVRERPSLVGLADDFQIVDEREAASILNEATHAWLKANPYILNEYLGDLEDNRRDWVIRDKLPAQLVEIAYGFIRTAKDLRYPPERLQNTLDRMNVPLKLAEMGLAIYTDYQQALVYRGAVDFDDLIRLALLALEVDEQYLTRLRDRWPYILEDEAQDSSQLQEEILRKLAGVDGNWIRVGDPNQAIYETFTTANPKYLREFMQQEGVIARELSISGRSSASIINLANYLVQWVRTEHPVMEVRDALMSPPDIEPTVEEDPQANPPDNPNGIHLIARKYSPKEEVNSIADSLERWLPANKESTVAVLVPRNQRGFEIVDELKCRKIEYVDSMLQSSSMTRSSAGVLHNLLRYLSDPGSARKLADVYRDWNREDQDDQQSKERINQAVELIRKILNMEDYLWPAPDRDRITEWESTGINPEIVDSLNNFRNRLRRWQAATLLPVDQLILTLSQDLLTQPTELALSHKLAILLKQASQTHLSWRLHELTEELNVIARNERRFLGFSDSDIGFNPDSYRGKVVVSTIHKAKGLEWDRVYIASVNNYDFPSGQEYDEYIGEKWFLRDQLNLAEETLAQLHAALSSDPYTWYDEGRASRMARSNYVRERLRLLYVGITRARKELVITWNSGRLGKMRPALPFIALQSYWEEHKLGRLKL
jgi:DNA helicase-2/ATP-dependent DNA helicase PcrA